MPEPISDLDEVFDRLQELLLPYAPPFVVRSGGIEGKRDHQLWSERPVEVAGRKRDETYFAGIIRQKGYVGFYFMPVDTPEDRKELFAPELLRLLEGKSCFHVERLDAGLETQVEHALARGFALYRERGWVG